MSGNDANFLCCGSVSFSSGSVDPFREITDLNPENINFFIYILFCYELIVPIYKSNK